MEIGAATLAAFRLLASGDAALWFIVWTSLMVAVLGLAIAAAPAVGAAWLIATHEFPGRRAVVVLAQAFLSFPTVLVGLVLYLLLTRQGPLGSLALLFTPAGMVLGQAVIGFPVVLAFSLSTLQGADPRLRKPRACSARAAGAPSSRSSGNCASG